ncbi:MAG: hypothetical protein KJ063_02175 [Anaerolineae bacterium]|nr:hypothetical protein [Anaerolineae bacterium]
MKDTDRILEAIGVLNQLVANLAQEMTSLREELGLNKTHHDDRLSAHKKKLMSWSGDFTRLSSVLPDSMPGRKARRRVGAGTITTLSV